MMKLQVEKFAPIARFGMQAEKFGQFKTGLLVPIKINERRNDYAFSPNPLPADWAPDVKLWPLITEARAAVSALDGAGGILPNPSLLFRPLQRREAIKSNRIEGTYVSAEEMLRYEVHKSLNKDYHGEKINDWQEVMEYDLAIGVGCERIAQGDPLDRKLICDLHSKLLSGSRGKDKSPGHFRDGQVYVSGSRYIPPTADLIESQFANLEEYLTSAHCDPLVRAFIAHYQFEAIHPFKDGNGRLGRLLLSLCIYKWLGHSHAWLYLSEYFEKNRAEYIDRMFNISTNGNWEEWIEFCLLGTIEQANSALDKCRKLNDIKRRYEQKYSQLSPRMGLIINGLLSIPYTDAVQLSRDLGVSRPTAQADILKLCEAGVLKHLPGTSRPKAYSASEIFEIAYD